MNKKLRKIISVLLVSVFLLTAVGGATYPAVAQEVPDTQGDLIFYDVPDSWFRLYVQFVARNNIMQGTGDGRFSPHMPLSRAMLATMFWRLEGEPAVEFQPVFSDVPSTAPGWYRDAVIWAHENGIVQGFDGRFDPYGEATREAFAVVLYRYAQFAGIGTYIPDFFNLNNFRDRGEISAWAVGAMTWAVYEELIRGVGAETLAPGRTATRAEAAGLFTRFIKQLVHPLKPLCPELEARIKRDYQITFNPYDLDRVWIEPYLGTYNGSVALYLGPGILDVAWQEEVAGHIFGYRTNQRILVWNDGAFYTLSGKGGFGVSLPSAYELGLLTAEDLWYVHLHYRLLVRRLAMQ